MSTKSKADISNSAIRMLLQNVGAYYDEIRGLPKFTKTSDKWKEAVVFFDGKCAYCNVVLDADNATQDHLVPINKTGLGLHAWGNIVPCCRDCNKEKHFGDWRAFVKTKNPDATLAETRAKRLGEFQILYRYSPGLELHEVAENLYADVGAVSGALIDLRLKQAQHIILKSLGKYETTNTSRGGLAGEHGSRRGRVVGAGEADDD